MRKCLLSVIFMCGIALQAQDRTVSVFVKNYSTNRAMDCQLASIRERLAVAFAELEGFSLVDVPQEPNGKNLSPAFLQTLGCDYAVVGGIVAASALPREVGEKNEPMVVYTLRMSLKILTVEGRSVDGLASWLRKMPVIGKQADPMNYYDLLVDQWIQDVVGAVRVKSQKWPAPLARPIQKMTTLPPPPQSPQEVELPPVWIKISTTIDKVVEAYESQTKGVNGERLAELRRVVGGAQIKLDDAVIGSAPLTCRVTPGLHRLRVERDWMKPYVETIRVTEGFALEVPLELSDEGIRKWGTIEKVQADCAKAYAEAAMTRGIKVNYDSSQWHDVGDGRVALPTGK